MMRLLFAFLLLALCMPCFAQLFGRVVKVSDGDTFTLLVENNKQIKIRLYGIDCPESKQAYGNVAKEYLADKIAGKAVSVEVKSTDRYKRTVGIVCVEDEVVNESLLREGLAWHYKQYDKSDLYAELEHQARTNNNGLWRDKLACPPWEYRRNTKH